MTSYLEPLMVILTKLNMKRSWAFLYQKCLNGSDLLHK